MHASASHFEGLAEKCNWLKRSIDDDSFGKALIVAGLSKETSVEWSMDLQVVSQVVQVTWYLYGAWTSGVFR